METYPALLALYVGEISGHQGTPLTKSSDAELWFFSSVPEQTVEQTIATLMIWVPNTLIMT